jgi:hypothetical protein
VWKKVIVFVTGLIFAFTFYGNINMIKTLDEQRKFRENLVVAEQNYKNVSFEELKSFYPWPDKQSAYRTIKIIEDNQFNVFSGG